MVGRGFARGLVRSSGVGAVLATVLIVLLAGCGGSSGKTAPKPTIASGGDPALSRDVSVHYARIGTFGEMDQTLTFTSAAAVPITIHASLVALDKNGGQLTGVTVTGIFGTELGHRVLMPGDNVDALVFEGAGSADVRDVAVRSISARAVPGTRPAPEPIVARVVNVVDYTVAARFAAGGVRVENANNTDVDVRVVFIIWNRPGKGQSQQAVQVLRLGGLTRVPARGNVKVTPSAADAATIEKFGSTNAESIKAYVVP